MPNKHLLRSRQAFEYEQPLGTVMSAPDRSQVVKVTTQLLHERRGTVRVLRQPLMQKLPW